MLNILLVEDNPGDVLLVREALAAHEIVSQLHVLIDGQQALDYLARVGAHGGEGCPDVLLLDLNLPKVDGSSVLAAFRANGRFKTTPVIVVTSSENQKERATVAALGVSRYFRKPCDFDEYMTLGAVIKDVLNPLRRVDALIE